MKPLTTVHRAAGAAGVAALLLAGTTACQAADADSNQSAGSESAPPGEEHSDDSTPGTEVGHLYYERYNDDGSTTVLRWDGTEAGEVETVTTGTSGDRMYQTIDVSRYGEYLSWGDASESGRLLTYNIETGEIEDVAAFETGVDSCYLPSWASDGRPQLVMQSETPGMMTILDISSGSRSDDIAVNNTCYVQQTTGDQADGTDLFYFNYDAHDVEFSRYGEIVTTGVGPAVESALGVEAGGMTAVSGDGSYVCVTVNALGGGGRKHDCNAIVDVATGEIVKQALDEPFQARWAYDSLVVRENGAISYYPTTGAAGDEPETTVPEPAELQEAELFGVTQGHTVEE